MTTTSAESGRLVLIDTNVLLSATDRDRSRHQRAVLFLSTDERQLAISPQIVREYLAVSTRPIDANGLGLSVREASANVEQLLDVMSLLAEGPGTTIKLLELIGTIPVVGKQIHDANVVAVALANGVDTIVTDNIRHFTRFASLITIEELGGTPL